MEHKSAWQERKTSSPMATEEMSGAWREFPWRKLEKHVYTHPKANLSSQSAWQHQSKYREAAKVAHEIRSSTPIGSARVTQDNQGKKTAGVDGVKSVTNARMLMVRQLHTKHWKHRKTPPPARRVWIPKPGKAERRPLGIPTIMERARQALVKLALEPAWEAVFEPNVRTVQPKLVE